MPNDTTDPTENIEEIEENDEQTKVMLPSDFDPPNNGGEGDLWSSKLLWLWILSILSPFAAVGLGYPKFAMFGYIMLLAIPAIFITTLGLISGMMSLSNGVKQLHAYSYKMLVESDPWSVAASTLGLVRTQADASLEPGVSIDEIEYWTGPIFDQTATLSMLKQQYKHYRHNDYLLRIEFAESSRDTDSFLFALAAPQCVGMPVINNNVFKLIRADARARLSSVWINTKIPNLYTLLHALDPQMPHTTTMQLPKGWIHNKIGRYIEFECQEPSHSSENIQKEIKDILAIVKKSREKRTHNIDTLAALANFSESISPNTKPVRWLNGKWPIQTLSSHQNPYLSAIMKAAIEMGHEREDIKLLLHRLSNLNLTTYDGVHNGQPVCKEDTFEVQMRAQLLSFVRKHLRKEHPQWTPFVLSICQKASDTRFHLTQAIQQKDTEQIIALIEAQIDKENSYIENSHLVDIARLYKEENLTRIVRDRMRDALLLLLKTQAVPVGSAPRPLLSHHFQEQLYQCIESIADQSNPDIIDTYVEICQTSIEDWLAFPHSDHSPKAVSQYAGSHWELIRPMTETPWCYKHPSLVHQFQRMLELQPPLIPTYPITSKIYPKLKNNIQYMKRLIALQRPHLAGSLTMYEGADVSGTLTVVTDEEEGKTSLVAEDAPVNTT